MAVLVAGAGVSWVGRMAVFIPVFKAGNSLLIAAT
jgi:hypothetical protein